MAIKFYGEDSDDDSFMRVHPVLNKVANGFIWKPPSSSYDIYRRAMMKKEWVFYGISILNITIAIFFMHPSGDDFVGRAKLYNIRQKSNMTQK